MSSRFMTRILTKKNRYIRSSTILFIYTNDDDDEGESIQNIQYNIQPLQACLLSDLKCHFQTNGKRT